VNFIGEWNIDNNILCEKIVKFFHTSEYSKLNKRPGHTFNGISAQQKKSTDLSVSVENLNNIEVLNNYIKELQKICYNYIQKYKWCNQYYPWTILEDVNIQYYLPSEAYYSWHTERFSSVFPHNNRHLVFMTYLNTVTDGGETEFYYQNLKIKPEIGKTLIWPSDWTHTHRGLPSPSQEKYIITGWYSFYNK